MNKMHRIRVDSNTYSVPSEYAYQSVELELSTETIRIWSSKGQFLAEHLRRYDRKKDYEDEQHSRRLIEKSKRLEEKKMLAWLLRLSPKSADFYKSLCQQSLQEITQLRKLFALGQIYTDSQIAQAIEDTLIYDACNAEYVRNILESKNNQLAPAGPLHVPHKTDALNMQLEIPNLDLYKDK